MKKADATFAYVYGDHLGSASLTTGPTGAITSQTRYYPYYSPRQESTLL